MRLSNLLLFFLTVFTVQAQSVLHFTRTSGYDHNTRNQSFALFTAIGGEIGVTVVDDPTGDQFSDLSTLLQFDVIVFSNTSGAAILDATQRNNFEAYVANGGSVLGIHAASDTYRHSAANGNNTGTWDFYPELIGASVQENPNHVNGTPEYSMTHVGTHASTANLPDPWVKNEEYYYWEGGYFGPDNTSVLEVEETVGPNGQVNSYDAARPMSWYRVLGNGSRVFYTALGHAGSSYTDDLEFREHIRSALAWLTDLQTAIPEYVPLEVSIHPNPARGIVTFTSSSKFDRIEVIDMTGSIVAQWHEPTWPILFDATTLDEGLYLVRMESGQATKLMVVH